MGRWTRLSIDRFHGIEVDPWPAQIAQVSMWLTDHLANVKMEEEFGGEQVQIPIQTTAHITIGNALEVDWNSVVPAADCSYVMGNPPFLGSSRLTKEQHADRAIVWEGTKSLGRLDYVTCWFRKAADYLNPWARAAFVATNSITQGEQANILWKSLSDKGFHIDFAYRSFKWRNEARGNAGVSVVVIGFSTTGNQSKRLLSIATDGSVTSTDVATINHHLVEGPCPFLTSRSTPISAQAQKMKSGNIPRDGGHLSKIAAEQRQALIAADPALATYIKRIYGSKEHLNGIVRYCLWLGSAPPAVLRGTALQAVLRRVRDARTGQPGSKGTAADTPALFADIHQPSTAYLLVPSVLSEKYTRIPVAFYASDDILTNAAFAIPDATMLTFELLSSTPFLNWVEMVSSRMRTDLQLSSNFVYNNFPIPEMTQQQMDAIAVSAQKVLDARSDDWTLAELYDPLAMPANLAKAHKQLDRDVLAAYGLAPSSTESEILKTLIARYNQLVSTSRTRSASR